MLIVQMIQSTMLENNVSLQHTDKKFHSFT